MKGVHISRFTLAQQSQTVGAIHSELVQLKAEYFGRFTFQGGYLFVTIDAYTGEEQIASFCYSADKVPIIVNVLCEWHEDDRFLGWLLSFMRKKINGYRTDPSVDGSDRTNGGFPAIRNEEAD